MRPNPVKFRTPEDLATGLLPAHALLLLCKPPFKPANLCRNRITPVPDKETAIYTIKERIGIVTLTLVAAFVGGAVSGHMFAASAVGAAAAPKMITAQKFMLVDANGKTRGVFGLTSRGVAQVAVFDGSGALRAGLGVASNGGPSLGIFGKDGKARAEVGINGAVSRIVLSDSAGTAQASIGVAGDGQSGFALMDKQGNLRATMIVAPDGSPTLRLADQNRARVGLDVTADGLPGLAMLSSDGKTRAALTLNADGSGALTLFDTAGKPASSVP